MTNYLFSLIHTFFKNYLSYYITILIFISIGYFILNSYSAMNKIDLKNKTSIRKFAILTVLTIAPVIFHYYQPIIKTLHIFIVIYLIIMLFILFPLLFIPEWMKNIFDQLPYYNKKTITNIFKRLFCIAHWHYILVILLIHLYILHIITKISM